MEDTAAAAGLLVLRLTVGLTLAAHGVQKLFGWFGGPGLDGTGRGLEALGFFPGRRHAFAAGLVEAIAGLMLAAGFVTPLAATITLSVMIVAAVTVHLPHGFFITSNGFEYTMVLGVAGWTLAFTGPGDWSVDAMVDLRLHGTVVGVVALGGAVSGAGLQLLQRRGSIG